MLNYVSLQQISRTGASTTGTWFVYLPKLLTFGMFFSPVVSADGLFTVAYTQLNDPHYDAFRHLQSNPLDLVPCFSSYFGSHVSESRTSLPDEGG